MMGKQYLQGSLKVIKRKNKEKSSAYSQKTDYRATEIAQRVPCTKPAQAPDSSPQNRCGSQAWQHVLIASAGMEKQKKPQGLAGQEIWLKRWTSGSVRWRDNLLCPYTHVHWSITSTHTHSYNALTHTQKNKLPISLIWEKNRHNIFCFFPY